MKKILVIFAAVALLAGCSKQTQYNNDLAGTWTVYKLTLNSSEVALDSLTNYSITFTSGGTYAEQDTFSSGGATHDTGTWQFEDSYGELAFTDTARVQTVYTLFNLTGNSMELRRNGYDRYMRKNQ